MDYSMPGFPVHHQLLEFTRTHVHWVGDAIQLSYPLLSSSSAFNLSQHQGLFKWVSSSHQVAKVLEFQLQHQSFPMNIQGWFPLGWTGLISLRSKESSPAPQSESINPLVFNLLWKLRDLHTHKKHSYSVSVWLCPSHPRAQLWLNS